jgi:hypothetical protein
VAKYRERLAVSKQTVHRFHMERFNLKNKGFAALENLDAEVDVNRV